MKNWWKNDIYLRKIPFLKAKCQIIKEIRNFFDKEGFMEVDTPSLQISPGLETHLHAFHTEFFDFSGEKKDFYLHTSPEFTMKKLLSAGLPKIYQIAHCYRNCENSITHSPEFLMLEWYRANNTYEILMEDCEKIIRNSFESVGKKKSDFKGIECNVFKDFEKLTLHEAFNIYADINLDKVIDDDLNPTPYIIKEEAKRIGVNTTDFDNFEDVFFKIMLDRIEPKLGQGVPTILYEYPISMAALSRPSPKNKKVAERFELYISSLELANAFSELTDISTQRDRFQKDMELKQQLYGINYPIDEDFMEALKYMPESTGIALGVERLIMLASGADNINDTLFAPVIY